MMSLVAAFDIEICSLDAINAFLNSTLDEVVVCDCPEGFKKKSGDKILLKKTLYGLPHLPLLWNSTLFSELFC